jgi:hypothetical protein
MAQLIGLIDPCPIDDLSAVAGDNVRQVVDDLGLGTLAWTCSREVAFMSMATALIREQPSWPKR